MKIEIESAQIETRSGSTKDGRSFTIRTQEAFVHKGAKYPETFRLQLGDSQAAFKPGTYRLAPTAYFVGRYGDLQLRRILELERADDV